MQATAAGLAFLSKVKESEWNDQRLYIEGVRTAMIKGNRYGVKTEQKHLFGEGDTPYFIQSGNREPSGSFKAHKSVIDALNIAAIAAGGRDMNDLVFDIVTTYAAQGNRPGIVITQIGCRTESFEYNWDQGATEMSIDVPYKYLDFSIEVL